MIDGDLNRIAVTDDLQEIDKRVKGLENSIKHYAQKHRNRINGVYEKDDMFGCHIEL